MLASLCYNHASEASALLRSQSSHQTHAALLESLSSGRGSPQSDYQDEPASSRAKVCLTGVAVARVSRMATFGGGGSGSIAGSDGADGGDGIDGGGSGEGDLDLLRDVDGKSDGDGEDGDGKSDGDDSECEVTQQSQSNPRLVRHSPKGRSLSKVVVSSSYLDMMINGTSTPVRSVVAGKGVVIVL
ncbi:hypothetical protein Tco_0629224 [Tanacetum coccineum]|uniref:Uncharacterized protein n=1 Tax=Tanacetum coccineum TaxID=301880 RepID=A0ABQ4WSG8_9ASTR